MNRERIVALIGQIMLAVSFCIAALVLAGLALYIDHLMAVAEHGY